MTTLQTLIRQAEAREARGEPRRGPTSHHLRAASARVRLRVPEAGGTIYVTVDGHDRYCTNIYGEGLWRLRDDGSWGQIIGSSQIAGRAHVRCFVVEVLAWEALS